MPTFRYSKLVRDNVPGFHIQDGHIVNGRQLQGEELIRALIDKLHEEADEVRAALSRQELIEELGDVQQVIDDICSLSGVSKDELLADIAKKTARKGGFSEGQYIESVTMPDEDDEWVEYCRNNPDKYPEIK